MAIHNHMHVHVYVNGVSTITWMPIYVLVYSNLSRIQLLFEHSTNLNKSIDHQNEAILQSYSDTSEKTNRTSITIVNGWVADKRNKVYCILSNAV